ADRGRRAGAGGAVRGVGGDAADRAAGLHPPPAPHAPPRRRLRPGSLWAGPHPLRFARLRTIVDGRMGPMPEPARSGPPRPPTLRDVAELAGVSIKTVSNVVNDFPHVRASTRRSEERRAGKECRTRLERSHTTT